MGQGASRGHPASTWWTRGLRVPWWWQQHPRGLSAEPGGGGNRARRRERGGAAAERVSARPVACALPRTAGDAARLGTHVSQETSLQAGAVPATRGKELRRGPEEPRPAQGQQPAPRTPPGLGFRRRHAGPRASWRGGPQEETANTAGKAGGLVRRHPYPGHAGPRGLWGGPRGRWPCARVSARPSPAAGAAGAAAPRAAVPPRRPATGPQAHTHPLPAAPPSPPGPRPRPWLRGPSPPPWPRALSDVCVPSSVLRNLLGFGQAGTPRVRPPLR